MSVVCESLSVQRANILRVRFFKKIQDWILKSERIPKWVLRFFTKQINPRSFGWWCVKKTEESTLEVDSSVPLTHHDLRDLGLICSVKKLNIHFRILSDFRIQSSMDSLKETHLKTAMHYCARFPAWRKIVLVHEFSICCMFLRIPYVPFPCQNVIPVKREKRSGRSRPLSSNIQLHVRVNYGISWTKREKKRSNS